MEKMKGKQYLFAAVDIFLTCRVDLSDEDDHIIPPVTLSSQGQSSVTLSSQGQQSPYK